MADLTFERLDLRDVEVSTSLGALRAASVELTNVEARPAASPPEAPSMERWSSIAIGTLRLTDARLTTGRLAAVGGAAPLAGVRAEPIAQLDGSLHADIVDAAWIFDADVTIPIGRGRIDFNRATVEHVGPDSSMGVSRMGVYVDAPNGRTYLFLWSATHVPGVQFERREGGLLPGWRGDRGSIDLQPLLEAVLSGSPIGTLASETRDVLARTRLSGEFQLGDGVFGDDRRRIVLAGRERGRNRVALSSLPSGRGIVLRLHDFAASELHWESGGNTVSTGMLTATMSLQLEEGSGGPEMTTSIAELVLHDVRFVGAEALSRT